MEDTTFEAIQFNGEIQGLVAPAPETANSFTALLELPPTQAVELLYSPDRAGKPPRHRPKRYPLTSFSTAAANLTFPSNAALIERAAKFSVFAGENSNSNTNSNSNSPEVKRELPESDFSTQSSTYGPISDLSAEIKNPKRKEREKKVKSSSKKRKSVADESSGDGEKLPYVHVRVRRGHATDSHSLAERARREKINARMKLLQELVPGCNKKITCHDYLEVINRSITRYYSTIWGWCCMEFAVRAIARPSSILIVSTGFVPLTCFSLWNLDVNVKEAVHDLYKKRHPDTNVT